MGRPKKVGKFPYQYRGGTVTEGILHDKQWKCNECGRIFEFNTFKWLNEEIKAHKDPKLGLCR